MEHIIRHISEPTQGGNLAVITGDFYGDNMRIKLTSLTSGKEYLEKPVSRGGEHTITFKMPESCFEAYSVSVETDDVKSNCYVMNNAKIRWLSKESVVPGDILRIFGFGLISLDNYKNSGYSEYIKGSDTQVRLQSDDCTYICEVIKVNGYNVWFKIPDNMENGTYKISVDSGVGGWSNELNIFVEEKKNVSDAIFNAAEFGMESVDKNRMNYKWEKNKADRNYTFLGVRSENKDDSSYALQNALDAAYNAGGGTVIVPNGRYRFKKGIRIPRGVNLVGETKNRVYFELPSGLGGEDGFGTPEEGMSIEVFIKGEGDFTLKNINILSIYTPVILAAPCNDVLPELIPEHKYCSKRGYQNCVDITRDANNITIEDCYILQEPTYFSQRKSNSDPVFKDEIWDGQGKETKMFLWAAVAICGTNIQIKNSTLMGGGQPIVLYGGQYIEISGNTIYSGIYSNCIASFSSDYYADNSEWHRKGKNVIIENNTFDCKCHLSRSINWLMEEHSCYYIGENIVTPRFWNSDSEGFNFHLWGDTFVVQIEGGTENYIDITEESIKEQYNRYEIFHKYYKSENRLKDDAFKNFECTIIDGRGLGQYRKIVNSKGKRIYFDKPLDCVPDNSTRVSLSQFEKFHNTVMVGNEIGEAGRALYYWGNGFESFVDGNKLYKNGGIVFEDLSKYKEIDTTWMQFAGNYYNQILYNEVYDGRGFASNISTVGCSTGGIENGIISLIIRGNRLNNDVSFAAFPRIEADNGLNYMGLVFEDNSVRNTNVGYYLNKNVEAVISNTEFENVDEKYVGTGENIKIV